MLDTTTAVFRYLTDDPKYETEKPYDVVFDIDDTNSKTNCDFTSLSNVPVVDARQQVEQLSLDTNGFVFLHRPSKTDLESLRAEVAKSHPEIVDAYLQEVMALVKNEFGAEVVVCFDWRVLIYFRSFNVVPRYLISVAPIERRRRCPKSADAVARGAITPPRTRLERTSWYSLNSFNTALLIILLIGFQTSHTKEGNQSFEDIYLMLILRSTTRTSGEYVFSSKRISILCCSIKILF
jgi:hypothetical protein